MSNNKITYTFFHIKKKLRIVISGMRYIADKVKNRQQPTLVLQTIRYGYTFMKRKSKYMNRQIRE